MFFLVFFTFIFLGLAYKLSKKPIKKILKGRHIVITGGSSGIGKAAAILAAQQGAHVSIIARNIEKLDEAQIEIKKHVIDEQQLITRIPVDVSHLEAVENNLLELEETVGPIFMLLNCAGLAICGKFEDTSEHDIKQLIDVNLLGTIYSIRAILPKFKQRKEGIIVLTASAVGLMGMYGYSVYSSTKFALRGLAESLYMEAKPYDISVTLALPPDTDTPGFENENKSKPKETKIMSETAGLHQPETVAKQLLEDALAGKFLSYIGFESWLLATLCVGMTPFHSLGELFLQSITLGPLRIIGGFYVKHFENVVTRCFHEAEVSDKED